MSEFELIERFFTQRFAALSARCNQVKVGIGDDAAVLSIAAQNNFVVSSDLLSAGRHFFSDANPFDVGFKSLAVNLSDLAAMGAKPVAFTLNLALPSSPSMSWLDKFSQGLFCIAEKFNCPLVGGDTTACDNPEGPIISITVIGQTSSKGTNLLRSGVKPEDDIWVSGLPGKARLGFLFEAKCRGLLGKFLPAAEQDVFNSFWYVLPEPLQQQCLQAVQRPMPEVNLGLAIHDTANSAIDLSDGFFGDLQHMLKQSGCGSTLQNDLIDNMWLDWFSGCKEYLAWLQQVFLVGGDDYALCFTALPKWRESLLALSSRLTIPLTRVGYAQSEKSFLISGADGCKPVQSSSFNHFKK